MHKHVRSCLTGPFHAWLQKSSVDTQVDKVAQLLTSAPEEIAEPVQKHVHGLAEEIAVLKSKLAVAEEEKKRLEQMLARTETAMRKV